MNDLTAINLNDLVEIHRAGLKTSKETLDTARTTKFIQQPKKGKGNYTKEKYQQDEMTLEEIDTLLKEKNTPNIPITAPTT
jgi:regulator of PEP synthase PpsR (kinase-PPPase family)